MRIGVYAASQDGARPGHVHVAQELGRTLAAVGVGIVYGGGRVGLMGAMADAALAVGGEVVGVITRDLLEAKIGHTGLSKLEVVESMHERKARMIALADGFCALPGGPGTLDELFEAWTWQQLGLHRKPVALLNADGFWQPLLVLLDQQVQRGYLRQVDRDALVVLDRPDELIARLDGWSPPLPKWTPEPSYDVLNCVGWIRISNRRLLVVRTHGRDAFYLPGGKPEPGETDPEALRREIAEELGLDIDPETIRPEIVIEAVAHGQPFQRLHMRCYTAKSHGHMTARNEIAETRWVDDEHDHNCAPAVRQVIQHLRRSGAMPHHR